MRDIDEIEPQFVACISMIAAVDLRQSRDTRPHLMALGVGRNHPLKLLDEDRPFRPGADQTHIPSQNVPELRYLIDPEEAQIAPDARQAGIVASRSKHRACDLLRVMLHGPKFIDHETFAIASDPLLCKDDRPSRS